MEKTLEEFLYDNDVYDAWQFVANTVKTIYTAKCCKDIVIALKARMADTHEQWLASLMDKFSEKTTTNGNVRSLSVKSDDMPVHQTNIEGITLSTTFLMDMLTKDFFQYARNAFDCMAQVVNAACLASKAEKLEKIDFGTMKNILNKATYSGAFPDMQAWFDLMANDSEEFKYIDAFCNRTKHICDVYQKVSMSIWGGENQATINPFYRKSHQHEKKDIAVYLESVYSFVEIAFEQFIDVLKTEVVKHTFIGTRYHNLKVYQQKLKDSPQNSFSAVYLDSTVSVTAMPDTIQILLLNKDSHGEITCRDCTIDTIYINDASKGHEFIGKYVATEGRGADTLVRYRTQKKSNQFPVNCLYSFRQWLILRIKKSFITQIPLWRLLRLAMMPSFRFVQECRSKSFSRSMPKYPLYVIGALSHGLRVIVHQIFPLYLCSVRKCRKVDSHSFTSKT